MLDICEIDVNKDIYFRGKMADDRNSVSMKLKIAFSGTKYFNAFLCWVSIYDFKYMNLKI